jgi:hypothetical protein
MNRLGYNSMHQAEMFRDIAKDMDKDKLICVLQEKQTPGEAKVINPIHHK